MTSGTLAVLAAWLLFGGAHVLLGFPPLRPWLAARLGEARFVAVFGALAATGLTVLAFAAAWSAQDGGMPWRAADAPASRWALAVVSGAGLLLALGALRGYPRSPMALFRRRFDPPRGFARISRHGFFVGFGLFALAHVGLARTAAQQVFFAGFALLSAIGAFAQDAKLRQRHGEAYREYERATSILPFLALLDGRQRLDASDRWAAALGRAALGVVVLLVLHPLWGLGEGAPFALALAAGGAWISWRRWRSAPPTPDDVPVAPREGAGD
jgi:uncharacterized membrane protein